MKWMNAYFLGYSIVLAGVTAALWKFGFLERLGMEWTAIGVAIALGIGLMVAVANSGRKESIQIDRE